MTNRTDILTQALASREADIEMYQINIDNYRTAISDIEANHADDADMASFAEQLRQLLQSSITEQRKEKVMANAIRKNMEML